MKKYIIIILLTLTCNLVIGQIPAGYYNGTDGLSGTTLQLQLHNIIDNHNSVSYSSLWTHFQNTDKKINNTVWDMYSDIPGGTPPYTFTFVSDQCGNYSGEGDCYNREHSWPQSWFNSSSPMSSDLFHIYPTDGYVNGQRGNYPFGETSSATWTSQNGSKKGPCSYPGNSTTVFEPIDEYKGDFARTYFYMSTRYYGDDNGWQSNEMVNGADIKQWARNMLIEWNTDDPVSEKEIQRNNAIYSIQNNRNPYIDHPEFACRIFGTEYPQPQFQNIPIDTVTVGNTYEFTLIASDEFNNSLSFLFAGIVPSWISISDQGNNTAILTGTPDAGNAGINQIEVYVMNNYSEAVGMDFSIEVFPLVGIDSFHKGNGSVILFPNPTSDVLYIKSDVLILSAEIYQADGRLIESGISPSATNNQINTTSLDNGFYLLITSDIYGHKLTSCFIKNQSH